MIGLICFILGFIVAIEGLRIGLFAMSEQAFNDFVEKIKKNREKKNKQSEE